MLLVLLLSAAGRAATDHHGATNWGNVGGSSSLAWVPAVWDQKHARGGLVWAAGSEWHGQPWRDDPYTTTRSAQFGNGYVASVLGGPEYVPSAYCAGNRAPISPTYNASVSGMRVHAVAMDLEAGVVQQLWCAQPSCGGAGASVMQTTYASEASPHLLVSEFVLNNTRGSSSLRVTVNPAPVQPDKSRVGGAGGTKFGSGADCMKWKSSPLVSFSQDPGSPSHTLSVGELSSVNKKGGNVSLAVVADTSVVSLTAAAGSFSAPQVRFSSRWTSAEAGGTTAGAVAAATGEWQGLAANVSRVRSLRSLHENAFAARRLPRGGGPITVTGSGSAATSLGLLLNASWYALMGTAPRPEPTLNRFGTGISSLNTNGYNGRTFWDMDTWVAPNWLLFGPEKAADGAISFRLDEAPVAAQCAREYNYAGLDFPWDVAFGATPANTNKAACPEKGNGHTEIHIGGDIAFLAYQRWMATHDLMWLKSTGWPLISGVAKYYASRATPADTHALGAGLIFKDASGPDESGSSHEKRGGSVYIAAVAKLVIAVAAQLAPLVQDSSFPVSEIAAKGAAIRVAVNHSFPSTTERGPAHPGSWHPEYTCTGVPCTGLGYQLGQHIKQADVTMLNFPFGWPMDQQTLSNDLTAYPITAKNAEMEGMNIMPLMVGWRDAGNDTIAAELYANLSTQLIEGPFYMWMEKTSGQSGAPNYLTSPGGWMQATWAGWGGLRLINDSLVLRSSRPPPGCESMTMRSVRFRGHLLDILVTAAAATSATPSVTVTLLPGFSAAAEQLSIVVGETKHLLKAGAVIGPFSTARKIVIEGSKELPPVRPVKGRVFNITKFGAVSGDINNHAVNTLAFQRAFAAAALAGPGSTVFVPSGNFFSGPVRFTASDQRLALEAGSRMIAAYTAYGNMTYKGFKTSWPIGPKEPEGAPSDWKDQFMPFIYAHNLTNVSLVGPGTVDGGGEVWWELKNKNGNGGKFPRNMPQRPYNVRFDGCTGVLVQDLVMVQPPFWNLVPTWCTDVEIDNVTIRAIPGESGVPAYNTDGIEPMYSQRVHIHDCFIINGDDSITVKSGSHHVLVENCVFQDGHGCNIGSVQGESISNVTFRNIQLNNTLLGGGRIKARHWVNHWVVVSDILFENISCVPGVTKCADNSVVEIDMDYGGGPMGKAGVTVRNAVWRNINVTGGHHAGNISCLGGNPCTGITLENVVWPTNLNDYVCQFATGRAVGDSPSANCLNLPPRPPPPPPPPPHPPAPPGPPSPPGPGPGPSPQCMTVLNRVCPGTHGQGKPCDACIKAHGTPLKAAACWPNRGEAAFVQKWCDGKR